ncbi:MAG: hypothetical protein MI717_12145 [Spirochaetales bacterium]|nr:hypothetical protein [Spirochaetales bacterium]
MAKRKTGIELYQAAAALEKKDLAAAPPSTPPQKTPTDHGNSPFAKPRQKTPGLLRTAKTEEPASERGAEKAARLMLLLGRDDAVRVMASLQPQEAEAVAQCIAKMPRVDAQDAQRLLAEFGQRFGDFEATRRRGGVDVAREILSAAFGAEEGERLLYHAVPEAKERPFAFLADLPFAQQTALLRKEPPSTFALVLPFLPPQSASRLLETQPSEVQKDIMLRMARSQKVSTEVLMAVQEALQKQLRTISVEEDEEIDGRSALAAILRHMDLSDEHRLLDDLTEENPDLAGAVREKLFTMDSVFHLRDKDLAALLAQMDEHHIALMLKGQGEGVKDRLFSCMSSRRALLVREEGQLMGPVPRSEADSAVRDFLTALREGEEAGTYVVLREEEDLVI